jgi:hypothetical protein
MPGVSDVVLPDWLRLIDQETEEAATLRQGANLLRGGSALRGCPQPPAELDDPLWVRFRL